MFKRHGMRGRNTKYDSNLTEKRCQIQNRSKIIKELLNYYECTDNVLMLYLLLSSTIGHDQCRIWESLSVKNLRVHL